VNVCTFDPLADRRWPDFVRTHPGSSVFHTSGWLDALRRTYGYTPVAYTTSAHGSGLENAIVFCEIRSWVTGRRLVSLPFADHCEPLVEQPDAREAIGEALEREVAARRWRSIELRPLMPRFAESVRASRGDGFCFHGLDLRPAPEDLFARFHRSSIQQMIRRAEREGLVFDEGRSEAHVRTFYGLMLLTRRRHQLPPQPVEWFRNLAACLGDRLRICLASKDGRAIAGLVLLRHEDTLVYKYGASDASTHNLGGMPFLLWNIIRGARDEGACRMDLGRSDPDNAGLITFKDRLGAQRTELRYLRYARSAAAKTDAGWGGRMTKRVIANFPDRLFASTGRLLYRHFG
jgi:CelD/BcsL family acetyltransferase involved in cellulose biosynthesis